MRMMYYCSRNVVSAIAERHRDWVQAVIDAFPPVGDFNEKRDIELWEEGSCESAYMIIRRRIRHDDELTRKIEDMLLDKLAGSKA